MLATSLFDYDLPEHFIARYPAEHRQDARMMVLDRTTGEAVPRRFTDLVEYLRPGDLLVRNNTKVRRGRFYGVKVNPDGAPGARFEALLLEPRRGGAPGEWQVMLRPGKRAKPGVKVMLLAADGTPDPEGSSFTVTGRNEDGTGNVIFDPPDPAAIEERCGHIPLPVYLRRDDEPADVERYQTVYAAVPGAVAAPTAGLHFTPETFAALEAKGVGIATLTLHVGAGTFKPVEAEHAEEHHMHFEDFVLPEETAAAINAARRAGGRILAVGTTTVRVLESCAEADGTVTARRGRTDIFLYPPYRPRAVDMLLTNFHLPKSTLLMLVSCFAPREKVLAAYELAKREGFRFYSYGDCMLLKP